MTWPTKWAGKSWQGGNDLIWNLTEAELRAFYDAVLEGKKSMLKAIGVKSFSHRKADRALQLLKAEGLIKYYDGEWRYWPKASPPAHAPGHE